MTKKVKYQKSWEKVYPWSKEGNIPGYATCKLCNKTDIFFGSMGKSALTSHARGTKHTAFEKNKEKTIPFSMFIDTQNPQPSSSTQLQQPNTSSDISAFQQPGTSQLAIQHSGSSSCSGTKQSGTSGSETSLASSSQLCATTSAISQKPSTESKLKWWQIKESVTQAEVLWCIHTVLTHQSLRNAEASVALFKRMFSDSQTAMDMKLAKDKTSYSIVYGIAPYCRNQLLKDVKNSDFYVVSFDESLNKYSQRQQLDILVRYWSSVDEVSTRYLNSVFLTKSTAVDLLNALKEGLTGLDWKKVIQISMDGPNVNIKLLRMLKKEIEEESKNNHQLLDIGSCGLHVLNVAFKTGVKKTGWNVVEFLRACYYLFKDSPSRRGMFIQVTKTSTFPQKFCSVRWLENSSVSKKALEIFDNLKVYVQHVEGDKSQKATQASKSFKCVQKALKDDFLRAKLAFFTSIAEDIEPFLKQFQTDAPMAPFLHGDLLALLKCFMTRFVKEEIISEHPLTSIDVSLSENLIPAKRIDLGYATKSSLRKSSNLKDLDVLHFRQDCRTCLAALVGKIVEKCPLKYPLIGALTFLDPKQIASSKEVAVKEMTKAMELLEESRLISPSHAQHSDREYKVLMEDNTFLQECRNYSRKTKLDSFWMEILRDRSGENLKKIIKILLPLSHGNASVERGFSVNSSVIVENLQSESLIAQRMVYDSVMASGGIGQFQITKEMTLSFSNANQRWKEALKAKKEKMEAEDKTKSQKRQREALAKELEEERKKLKAETAISLAKLDERIKDLKKPD